MKTYFITENYLKTYTGYNNNIDMSKVEYLIKTAYDINITELLGSHFGEYLVNKHQQVISNNAIYDSFETVLIDLIQHTMAWKVNEDSIIELTVQLQNKGAIKQTGDYQIPSDNMLINAKKTMYKQNFESYKRKLNNYLCRNHDKFIEFMNDLNDDSIVKKNCKGCNSGLDDLEDYGLMVI